MPRYEDLVLFSTCPPSNGAPSASHSTASYLTQVQDVARWSEAAGCTGILIYTDNGLVTPWSVAQVVAQCTRRLEPLVAVQPVYLSPYWAAKEVASLALLHGRRVWLNMLAGGFKNDLAALGDQTPHDERYARTVEYAQVIEGLLRGTALSFAGRYYQTDRLKLAPAIPPELRPRVLISGSSAAGLAAAKELGAVAVQYPKPAPEHATSLSRGDVRYGVRLGILARPHADEAWRLAMQRFPPDRKGQIAHDLALRVSDSAWHQQLSELGKAASKERSPYWLEPFQSYQTFCPYLVGDHATVAAELAGYLRLGIATFILDVPRSPDDLEHATRAFALALERAAA